jgi:hypothetical protein
MNFRQDAKLKIGAHFRNTCQSKRLPELILLRGIQLTLVQRYRSLTVKMVFSYKMFTFFL